MALSDSAGRLRVVVAGLGFPWLPGRDTQPLGFPRPDLDPRGAVAVDGATPDPDVPAGATYGTTEDSAQPEADGTTEETPGADGDASPPGKNGTAEAARGAEAELEPSNGASAHEPRNGDDPSGVDDSSGLEDPSGADGRSGLDDRSGADDPFGVVDPSGLEHPAGADDLPGAVDALTSGSVAESSAPTHAVDSKTEPQRELRASSTPDPASGSEHRPRPTSTPEWRDAAGPTDEAEAGSSSSVIGATIAGNTLGDDVSRETPPNVSRETSVDVSRETPSETPVADEIMATVKRRSELHNATYPRPDVTRVLTVANQKGGVGKTTTAVNVAAGLAQAGLRVLVIDLDPQGNASTALGVDHHADVPSIYDVLIDSRPMADIVRVSPDLPTLFCAPATIDLAGAEIELVPLVAREMRLQRAVTTYLNGLGPDERLDYVLIDCPPSLGLLTVNAFVAASEVFIPIQCEYYALEGLSQLLKNIELIKSHLNPELHVSTILLTMYDARTRLSAQVADEVRTHFGPQTLRTTVPRSVRISEAPSHGQTVISYDPASSGALSYLEAASELANRGVAAPVADGADPTTSTAGNGSGERTA